MSTALRLARRELRSGVRSLRPLIACLAIGVAAIAAIGSVRAALLAGLRADARALLGGDLELVSSASAIPGALTAHLRGATLSQTLDLRAMARHGDAAALVELKAVDALYPLYGAVHIRPAQSIREALDSGGALIDPTLASRLHVGVGDTLMLGEARLEVRGFLETEPDRGIRGFALGPRVMIASDAVAATGLVQPGSIVRHSVRAKLAAGDTEDEAAARLEAPARSAGVHVITHKDATPGVKRLVDRVAQFLTLVALTALLVGGVGVANAVAVFIESRLGTIAILKCVGADTHTVRTTYLVVTAALASLGILIGLLLGAALPPLVLPRIAEVLPIATSNEVHWQALALAAGFGATVTLIFALWPLSRIDAISPAELFRAEIVAVHGRPSGGFLVAILAATGVLVGLAVLGSTDTAIAAGFVAATALAFGVFALVALGVSQLGHLARRVAPSPLAIGLRALRQRPSLTRRIVLSLGLGLTVLTCIAVIENNLGRELSDERESQPPAFFFLDIQRDEGEAFEALLLAQPGVSRVERTPLLRGRITALRGEPVESLTIPERAKWAIESDRGITYASEPPERTKLTSGAWWARDYEGEPLVSFDGELADDLGLAVGDTMSFVILGRPITARIASLRDIDWRGMGINFAVIMSPSALRGAPHTYLATAYVAPSAETAVFDLVAKRLPHVSTIRVRDAIERLRGIVAAIAAAVRVAAVLTLVMGLLVLVGGMIATQSQRIRDAVIFKVLGASRRDIVIAFVVEHGVAGGITALVAAVLGSLAAHFVLVDMMQLSYHGAPYALAATLALGVGLSLVLGFAGTARALGRKPADVLREQV